MAKSRGKQSFDTARQRIGTVYAKALLGASERASQTSGALDELDSLIEVLDAQPDFDEALRTPRISHEEKIALLDRVFSKRMSPLVLNFLKVVSQHERLDCLRAIQRAAQKLYNQMKNRVEVLVETAAPLNNRLQTSIAGRLQQLLGREVVLSTAVNPDLLGGLVVRVGDTVYDGSLAGRLKNMQAVTLEHTTDAIRQKLERFAMSESV